MSAARQPLQGSLEALDATMTETAVVALLCVHPDVEVSGLLEAAPAGHLAMRRAINAAFPGAPDLTGLDATLIAVRTTALSVLARQALVDLARQMGARSVPPLALIQLGGAWEAFDAAIHARTFALTRNGEAKKGDWQSEVRTAVQAYMADRTAVRFEAVVKAAEPLALNHGISTGTLQRRMREWHETRNLPGKGRRKPDA